MKEEIYDSQIKPEHLMQSIEWMNDDLTELISEKLIHPKPNTYTFTKGLAEALIMKEMEDLPCAIVRPSIIGATWREPFSGWIDNFNGPSALFPAVGTGLLRSMFGTNLVTSKHTFTPEKKY